MMALLHRLTCRASAAPRSLAMALALCGAAQLGAGAAPAVAAPVVLEVDSEADGPGDAPRQAAVDRAFADATRQVLSSLVSTGDRKTHKATLDKDVVARARLWVTSFKVVRDELRGEQRVLTVSVKIDRDKLAARLDELGVPRKPDAAAPSTHSAVVLLRVVSGERASASYGLSARTDVVGLSALAGAASTGGYAVVPATASGAAAKPGDGLPLSDDDARGFAGDARADLAIIAGVNVGPWGPVRGRRERAGWADAIVRVVRVADGEVIGNAEARGYAYAEDAATAERDAVVRALTSAVARALPAQHGAGGHGGPSTVIDAAAPSGQVLVRVSASGFAAIRLFPQKVAGSRLVAATPKQLGWWVPADSPRALLTQVRAWIDEAGIDVSASLVGAVIELR